VALYPFFPIGKPAFSAKSSDKMLEAFLWINP
jgi:hypothetical protein